MAFLTDGDIRKAVKAGKISIEPFDPGHVGPASVDFTLGNEFKVFRMTGKSEVDTKDRDSFARLFETIRVKDGDYFLLPPKELVLGMTKEKLGTAPDIIAFIEGKSSLARLGIAVHVTAGLVNPGSSGSQVLEMTNLSNFPIRIYPGSRICQVVFAETKSPAEVPYSKVDPKRNAKYIDQKSPEMSRLHL